MPLPPEEDTIEDHVLSCVELVKGGPDWEEAGSRHGPVYAPSVPISILLGDMISLTITYYYPPTKAQVQNLQRHNVPSERSSLAGDAASNGHTSIGGPCKPSPSPRALEKKNNNVPPYINTDLLPDLEKVPRPVLSRGAPLAKRPSEDHQQSGDCSLLIQKKRPAYTCPLMSDSQRRVLSWNRCKQHLQVLLITLFVKQVHSIRVHKMAYLLQCTMYILLTLFIADGLS